MLCEPSPRTTLPGRAAILAVPGTETLAARLAAMPPGAEVLTPAGIDADLTDPHTLDPLEIGRIPAHLPTCVTNTAASNTDHRNQALSPGGQEPSLR